MVRHRGRRRRPALTPGLLGRYEGAHGYAPPLEAGKAVEVGLSPPNIAGPGGVVRPRVGRPVSGEPGQEVGRPLPLTQPQPPRPDVLQPTGPRVGVGRVVVEWVTEEGGSDGPQRTGVGVTGLSGRSALEVVEWGLAALGIGVGRGPPESQTEVLRVSPGP